MDCGSSTMTTNNSKNYNILVACTGSVATVKVPQLVDELVNSAPASAHISAVEVRVMATEHSLHFLEPLERWPQLRGVRLYRDRDEWTSWSNMGDPVLHIELRRWADVLVVAPLDANTLAKMAAGLCDNLVTCVTRAWPIVATSSGGAIKPLLICPAMNTCMWEHPLTAAHLNTLTNFGYRQVAPVSKRLACGDEGMGAMADVRDIAKHTWDALLTSGSKLEPDVTYPANSVIPPLMTL